MSEVSKRAGLAKTTSNMFFFLVSVNNEGFMEQTVEQTVILINTQEFSEF